MRVWGRSSLYYSGPLIQLSTQNIFDSSAVVAYVVFELRKYAQMAYVKETAMPVLSHKLPTITRIWL